MEIASFSPAKAGVHRVQRDRASKNYQHMERWVHPARRAKLQLARKALQIPRLPERALKHYAAKLQLARKALQIPRLPERAL